MNNLKVIMQERDISEKELASYLGMTTQAVGRYITGRAYPNVMLAMKIADYLKLNVTDIWSYKDIPEPDI